MTNVLSVCPPLHLDYIIPRLVSCVFQSLPVVRPSNGLPPQSGLSTYRAPELLSLKAALASEAKELSDLMAKGKGPPPAVCHYRLIKT